ncbi:MAG: PorP/SprF family type IX secretion system membrane protein, partial [Candidatus Saccharimonadales bacterium]
MKKNILFAAIGLQLLAFSRAGAQDAAFTQLYASPLLTNPAIVGASNFDRTSLAYRNQWGSVNSGYSDYNFMTSTPFFLKEQSSKIVVSLAFVDDKAGAFSQLNGYLSVAYNKKIAENQNVCLALYGAVSQLGVNTNGLTYDDQFEDGAYNSAISSGETALSKSVIYPDAGFGFTWYMNPSRDDSKFNAYAGIAGFHMNEPNQSLVGSLSTLPIRMSYIAGLKLFESDKVDFSPNMMVTTQAGNIISAVGMYCCYSINENFKATLGLWYRTHDAIPIVIGFAYKGYELGYSYDMVTSSLTAYSTGLNANEITLTVKLPLKKSQGSTAMIGSKNDSDSQTPSTLDPNPSPFP